MGCNGSRYFNVLFAIRKGLGPDTFDKTVGVLLDDIPCGTSEADMKSKAVADAENILMFSDDFKYYGKNWRLKEVTEG